MRQVSFEAENSLSNLEGYKDRDLFCLLVWKLDAKHDFDVAVDGKVSVILKCLSC